jgi:GPH family glycoside/pentoside/hexuronide:cation symporter
MKTENISFHERLAYSFGDIAGNLSISTINWLIVYYYVNVMHMASGPVGTIMMAVFLLDSVFDVVMGILVDKTKSRMGKARPWRMCVPTAVIFVLLFSVPSISETGKTVYMFVTFLLFYLIYSAINVPYGILNSLISKDQYERSILNIFRMIMAYGTNIFVGIATLKIVLFFGGSESAWRQVAILYSVCMIVLFLLTFFFTKERTWQNIQAKTDIPVIKGLKAILKNKYSRIITIYALVLFMNVTINSEVTVYFTGFYLNSDSLVGLMTLTFYIPIVVGMFFLFIIRYGKRNMSVVGIAIAFFGTLLPIFNPHSLALVIIGNIIKGVGMIPVFGSLYAMVADTIEYGEWKTGLRTEGLVYSTSSFGIKVGSGLGSAVLGWVLAIGGYRGGAAKQTFAAGFAIEFLYIILPLLLLLLLVFILTFYRLDREYAGIIEDLEDRKILPDEGLPLPDTASLSV